MKRWIVREGAEKKKGRYLWEASPTQWDWTANQQPSVLTVGGGSWLSKTTTYIPWWDEAQAGAMLFADRRSAVRMAKRLGGRAVLLPSKSQGEP